jgi:hypothetical protein
VIVGESCALPANQEDSNTIRATSILYIVVGFQREHPSAGTESVDMHLSPEKTDRLRCFAVDQSLFQDGQHRNGPNVHFVHTRQFSRNIIAEETVNSI